MQKLCYTSGRLSCREQSIHLNVDSQDVEVNLIHHHLHIIIIIIIIINFIYNMFINIIIIIIILTYVSFNTVHTRDPVNSKYI